MDEYVEIPGYPGYKINRNGDCIGSYGRILKRNYNGRYYDYHFSINGKAYHLLVHRLVALTFIPNPEGLETVDHINEDKADNCVENLRWMSRAENMRRASVVVNAKNYYPNKGGFQVQYRIGTEPHNKRFKDEEDAQFYVSLLKAIYPRF